MLLLLSHFSRVRLCATPEMAAHQAPPSLGSSRLEHWSGLPFPSPMCESEVTQSYLTQSDPMDYSLPGSSVHRIHQARVLEWVAIAFSNHLYTFINFRCPPFFLPFYLWLSSFWKTPVIPPSLRYTYSSLGKLSVTSSLTSSYLPNDEVT